MQTAQPFVSLFREATGNNCPAGQLARLSAMRRTMAGIGSLGFNTGVYIDIRFTDTVLRAPDIGFPCGAGTIDAYIDSGVGYSIQKRVTEAINFLLSVVSKIQIDRAGSLGGGSLAKALPWRHADTKGLRHA